MSKNIKILVIILLFLSLEAKEILIDANGDNNNDLVSYRIISMQDNPNINEPYIEINIKTKNKEYSYNAIWIQYPIIKTCGKGCIKLLDIRGKYEFGDILKYKYNKIYDDWFTKSDCNNSKLCYLTNLNNVKIPSDTLFELEKKLSLNYNIIAVNITFKYLNYYLKKQPIIQKTLTQYNNIAYYLQKAGANNEAIYLLEKILNKYPNRTVAHYNIADAYWDIDNKQKAIKH